MFGYIFLNITFSDCTREGVLWRTLLMDGRLPTPTPATAWALQDFPFPEFICSSMSSLHIVFEWIIMGLSFLTLFWLIIMTKSYLEGKTVPSMRILCCHFLILLPHPDPNASYRPLRSRCPVLIEIEWSSKANWTGFWKWTLNVCFLACVFRLSFWFSFFLKSNDSKNCNLNCYVAR